MKEMHITPNHDKKKRHLKLEWTDPTHPLT